MTQHRLTSNHVEKIEKLASDLMCAFDWTSSPEGAGFWDNIQRKLWNRAKHGTTDGKPWIEPELTDEDATKRPLVFGRVNESYAWQGPFVLIRARESDVKYIVEHPSGCLSVYPYCRLATPEEIEAASGNR
jgi:hypothetical protein